MDKEKFKDFFTEYNFKTINFNNLKDKTDYNLRKLVPEPLNNENTHARIKTK